MKSLDNSLASPNALQQRSARDGEQLSLERQGRSEGRIRNLLRERGIPNGGALITSIDADAILGAIRWYDEQPRHGKGAVGPGLLATVLRDGGMPGYGTAGTEACARTDELDAEWAIVVARLDELVAQEPAGIPMPYTFLACWVPLMHPHSHDTGGWTVAARTDTCAWIRSKPGRMRLLSKVAGAPVRLIECDHPPLAGDNPPQEGASA